MRASAQSRSRPAHSLTDAHALTPALLLFTSDRRPETTLRHRIACSSSTSIHAQSSTRFVGYISFLTGSSALASLDPRLDPLAHVPLVPLLVPRSTDSHHRTSALLCFALCSYSIKLLQTYPLLPGPRYTCCLPWAIFPRQRLHHQLRPPDTLLLVSSTPKHDRLLRLDNLPITQHSDPPAQLLQLRTAAIPNPSTRYHVKSSHRTEERPVMVSHFL